MLNERSPEDHFEHAQEVLTEDFLDIGFVVASADVVRAWSQSARQGESQAI